MKKVDKMRRVHSVDMYTGRVFEEEVLCKCEWRWRGYVTFNESVKRVKRNQPKWYDPTDPYSQAANDLHALICQEMGIEYQSLKLFTAVGSPLDRYHKVDAFFEWEGKVIITIDTKLDNRASAEDIKADILLRECDVYDSEGKSNLVGLTTKAKQIAKMLRA